MSQNIPSSLRLRVITSRQMLADEEVHEVNLPSLEGYLGILPGHRPLLVALGQGELSYKRSNKQESFSIQGGYAEVHPERVLVFTEISKDDMYGSDKK
jgi:F-type H+-transporting ATPase subunit epsilon